MCVTVSVISGVQKMTMIVSGVARDIHDFLVKPVKDEVLRNILQQMARRRQSAYGEPPVPARHPEEGDRQQRNSSEDSDGASYMSETGSRKRSSSDEDMPPAKKRRLVWSPELHELFIRTVELLGVNSTNNLRHTYYNIRHLSLKSSFFLSLIRSVFWFIGFSDVWMQRLFRRRSWR